MPFRDSCAVRPLQRPDLALAVLGTGRVGSALLERLGRQAPPDWTLEVVMNSRHGNIRPAGPASIGSADSSLLSERIAPDLGQVETYLRQRDARTHVVIDATASPAVAQRHAQWLQQGLCVISANKLALASEGPSWQVVDSARKKDRYGASATVGAGLPILDSLTRLGQAGEPVTAIRAVLSGSMSWISQRLGEGAQASPCVLQAHEAGLTEPDPRDDLGGQDVARKLLILARAAGIPLDPARIEVASLVPESLRGVSRTAFFERIGELDEFVRECLECLPGQGRRLIHSATLATDGSARVGLEWVESSDSLAGLSGPENRIEVYSPSYSTEPLAISGPGAGIEVTALALWSDLRRISECARSGR